MTVATRIERRRVRAELLRGWCSEDLTELHAHATSCARWTTSKDGAAAMVELATAIEDEFIRRDDLLREAQEEAAVLAHFS